MAIAIGANVAVWAAAYSAFLAPLPYPHGARLVSVVERLGGTSQPVPQPLADAWRSRARSFAALAEWRNTAAVVESRSYPSLAFGIAVSRNIFTTLGMPGLAQALAAGPPGAVLLSRSESSRLFAGGRALGRMVVLDGRPHEVVGVLPGNFVLPGEAPDLAYAVRMRHPSPGVVFFVNVVGLLRPGVTGASAEKEVAMLQAGWRGGPNGTGATRRRAAVVSLRDALCENYSGSLYALIAASTGILLLAWANVAGLETGRLWRRRQEFFVRVALGAGRVQLLRAAAGEGVWASVAGAAGGTALGTWAAERIRAIGIGGAAIHPHWPGAAGVAAILAVATMCVIGVIPGAVAALRSAGPGAREAVKPMGALAGWRILVALQVALSTSAAASALLLAAGTARLLEVRPGFRPQGALAAAVSLPAAAPPTLPRELLRSVRDVPGVEAAALVNSVPLLGIAESGPVSAERNGTQVNTALSAMTPGALGVLGVRLIAGRSFDSGDGATGIPVAIINGALARAVFGSVRSAVRKRIWTQSGPVVVVGVATGFHQSGIRSPVVPELFRPIAQSPSPYLFVVVRSRLANAMELLPDLRRAVADVAPGTPLTRVVSLQATLRRQSRRQRQQRDILASLAALSILLVVLGAYGVGAAAAAAAKRTTAIRKALGAGFGDVVGSALKPGLAMALGGGGVGMLLAIASSRYLGSFLFRTPATSVPVFLAAAGLVSGSAVIAYLPPALRTWRADTQAALREE